MRSTAGAAAPRSSAAALATCSCSASSSVELGSPGRRAHAAGLVGQVDLEAVPAQLPHHGDRHDAAPRSRDGRTATAGAPSERATPPTVRGCSEALKSSSARGIFSSAFVGHRVDVARLARRLAGSRLGRSAACSGAASLGVAARSGTAPRPRRARRSAARRASSGARAAGGRRGAARERAVVAAPPRGSSPRAGRARCTARRPSRRVAAGEEDLGAARRAAACARRRRRRRRAAFVRMSCPGHERDRG